MYAGDVAEDLKSLECPITWPLEKCNLKNVTKKLIRKTTPIAGKEDDASSQWQAISLYFTLAYVEYHSPEGKKMNEYLKQIEDISDNRRKKLSSGLVRKYSRSVIYVTSSMWAYYYYKDNNIDQMKIYLSRVTPFDTLKNSEKAGVMALKACCIMALGPQNGIEAKKAIEMAVRLDGEEAEWNFLKGKCLARSRRYENYQLPPTDEEIRCLKKAVEKAEGSAKSPSHYVFLALSLQQRAIRTNGSLIECSDIFEQAYKYSYDHPICLARIARGALRSMKKSSKLAAILEKCVKRSLELCPEHGMVNHVAANYYQKTKKESRETYMFHLKKAAFECGVYGAYINLFDMYTNNDRSHIDIKVALKNFWEEFKDQPADRFKALKYMAAYHISVGLADKKDLLCAIRCWMEWMQSPINTKKDETSTCFIKCANLTREIENKVRAQLRPKSQMVVLPDNGEWEMKRFLQAVEKFYQT